MSVDYATPDYHQWVFDEPSPNWNDDASSTSPESASPFTIKDVDLKSAFAPPRPALKYECRHLMSCPFGNPIEEETLLVRITQPSARKAKRQGQNRAAQRAFRERRIKLVKDLESDIKTLAVTLASTREENNLLKSELSRFKRGVVLTRSSSSRYVCPTMCPGIGADACGFGGSYPMEGFIPWQGALDEPFPGPPNGSPSP
ncbi:DNA-binding transcription factor yap1 [Elasticomyces elasticus]|uniref:DNA-binding transcription factor yap1 n=1 Tax=Elasticomyces elasticus TaxID=574655 RepID=A0AAN7WCA2_9PEZI|nr:DNA-binding transcription factor yap1 [Elasticomyces elasticus]